MFVSVKGAYATYNFNICNIFPNLPQCNPTPSPSPSPSPYPSPTLSPDPSPSLSPSPTPQVEQPKVEASTPSTPEAHPPICTHNPPKPAVNLGGVKVDGNTAKLTWSPTTDPIDKQILVYGPSLDKLTYGIPSLPSNATEVDVDTVWSGHTFFGIGSDKDNCVSWVYGDP